MTKRRRQPWLHAVLCLSCCAVVPGCAEMPDDAVTPEGTIVQSRLTAVHWLYNTFRSKRNRSPADAQELNDFGQALPTSEGGPVLLSDEFLTSPRDKKPIVVLYDLDLTAGKSDGNPLLAYEQQGFKGRRFVVHATSGRVEELDEPKFRELTQ